MVDLRDRINKPRALRGTPSYAYINKLCVGIVALTTGIGVLYGYIFWQKNLRRPFYEETTLEEVQQARQEERIRAYVENRRRVIESARREAEEDEMYRL